MKAFRNTILITILIFCFSNLIFSQIKLTSPQNRAVYQRNGFGFSAVLIAGSYEKQVDKIEARLIPIQAGQGSDTEYQDWKTIKILPLNGNFSFIMSVRQGWYRLEVRGSLNGNMIGDVVSVDRMGVGEVFIIAGQSNAEGVDGIASAFVDNDRVNCLSTLNNQSNGGSSYISLSPFSQLQTNSRIAPRGKNAWCWGRLGELLVNRLNVPVMFFNVALNGTTVAAWAETANGNFTANPYIGGVYANKLPYQNMSDVLKYFVPELGVRAILWCQGESDNVNSNAYNKAPNEQTYVSNLQTVINKTRSESGKNNLNWVISLTSFNSGSDPKIIRAQQTLIQQPNVIQGPNTDVIQPEGRQEGVHFTTGLSQLADAWNNSLTDAFFQTSTGYIPVEYPELAFNCGDNRVDVILPDNDKKGNKFLSYQWSNNGLNFDSGIFSTQKQITLDVDGGRQYFARMRDALGNVVQVPPISFKGSNLPISNITAVGATDFCEGNKAILKANNGVIFEWNNGSRTQEITVATSGTYSVKSISDFGCQTGFSAPSVITVRPVPPKPFISANSSTIFCADSSVILESSTQGATSFMWSNGSNNRNIKINTSGNYTVKAVSDKGCASPDSDPLKITANPLPTTPSISPDGPTTFCADSSVILESSNQASLSYRWSNGSNSPKITVRNGGDYSVKTVDKNGCVSLSSAGTRIKVNALPLPPNISSTRDTVFCQGESTTLQSNLVNGSIATWFALQDGTASKYSLPNLNVNRTGSFQAIHTDVNGCKSKLSTSIFVAVKAVPTKVENIIRLSPYTVGVENPKATNYVWQFNNTVKPNYTGSVIRFNEEGQFRVTAKNVYKTLSYGEKTCISEPSEEKFFTLFNDNGMSIYPNPSNGLFNIDSKIDWKNSTIEIYSLVGQFIKKGFVNVFDDVKKIDLTDLPEGEYMLRIKTDNFYTITKRLFISR